MILRTLYIGFKEATDIVNGFTLVNQCKTLINNLLGKFENSSSSPPNFSFYWDSNKDGIKEIKCISEMEGRIQRNNNIRNRYLGGLYNGIPSMMYVDFEDLLDILE